MNGISILLLIDGIFVLMGLILILTGCFIHRASHNRKKIVEINANCVEVKVEDYYYYGTSEHPKVMKNAKTPIYEYSYNGKSYRSSPAVHSNLPGYHPEEGPCKIRINREEPEKIYYSQRGFVPKLLAGMGIAFIACTIVITLFLLPMIR